MPLYSESDTKWIMWNPAKREKEQREIFLQGTNSMQRVATVKTDHLEWTPSRLLANFQQYLHEQDRSPGTVKKYTQAISHFLVWYEHEERVPLQLSALTPIALIGYRNELQHVQHKSVSTINLRISALRAWCAWLVDQGYLPLDPAARVKLIGSEAGSKREGLESSQINALLRQAQVSRDPARNYAIVQVLLQTGIRLSECSGLTFSDITFGERSGLLLVRAGKGNKVRSVPLNASAREALATYVAPRLGVGKPSIKAVASQWPKPRSERAHMPVFESQKGGALTTSAMGQMIDDLVTAAGELVPQKTSAHTLRHTFAHQYLAQFPGDVVGLATLLGHRSLDTTRLYSQPTVSQLSTRVEQLKINAYAR
jgi:site-specific recombinase XerD